MTNRDNIPTRAADGSLIPSTAPDLAERGTEAGDDVGRARLVLDALRASGRDLVHSPAFGLCLYEEETGVWDRTDADLKVRRAFHALGRDLRGAAADVFADVASDDEDARKAAQAKGTRLLGIASRCSRTAAIECGMRELAALVPRVSPDEFDALPDYIVASGQMVNLATGEAHAPMRGDLVTQDLPDAYDPDAKAPRWEAFLREVFVKADGITPDEELVSYVQRLIGYGITGHTSEQVLAVLHGDGANGKSLFVDVLSTVFAPLTRTAAFETFGVSRRDGQSASPDLARLAGARLVFASEGDDGLALAEGLVKRLTGQETITARMLNRDPFEYRSRFLICLVSNHLPVVRGTDHGVWRRIKVIPFRRTFTTQEQDRDLRDKLLAERAGILAWAVRGAQDWYAAGKSLGEPDAVRRVTATYRASSDRVRDFLQECVVVTGDAADTLSGNALRTRYSEWCRAQDERPFGRNTFFERVLSSDRRIRRDDSLGWEKRGARFLGLRLPTGAEELGLASGARLGLVPSAVDVGEVA